MTLELFICYFIILCSISGLLTQAIKKAFENAKKNPSANLIALIDGIVVGGIGTSAIYVWLGIAFTLSNILAIVAMIFGITIGSMIGYDKVIQTIEQLKK